MGLRVTSRGSVEKPALKEKGCHRLARRGKEGKGEAIESHYHLVACNLDGLFSAVVSGELFMS